jgi:hypothetical protein
MVACQKIDYVTSSQTVGNYSKTPINQSINQSINRLTFLQSLFLFFQVFIIIFALLGINSGTSDRESMLCCFRRPMWIPQQQTNIVWTFYGTLVHWQFRV